MHSSSERKNNIVAKVRIILNLFVKLRKKSQQNSIYLKKYYSNKITLYVISPYFIASFLTFTHMILCERCKILSERSSTSSIKNFYASHTQVICVFLQPVKFLILNPVTHLKVTFIFSIRYSSNRTSPCYPKTSIYELKSDFPLQLYVCVHIICVYV